MSLELNQNNFKMYWLPGAGIPWEAQLNGEHRLQLYMGSNSSGAKKLGNVAINNALPLEVTMWLFIFHFTLICFYQVISIAVYVLLRTGKEPQHRSDRR